MSSLIEQFEQGGPMPIKHKAHAKYVAHGHLASAEGDESNVYFAMLYGDDHPEDPEVHVTVEQIAARSNLSATAVKAAVTSLVKKGMVMRQGKDKLLILEPPDNFDFVNRMKGKQDAHADDPGDEDFGGDSEE